MQIKAVNASAEEGMNIGTLLALVIVRKGKPETARHRKSRANWYKRAKDYLDQFLRDWPIGVITT